MTFIEGVAQSTLAYNEFTDRNKIKNTIRSYSSLVGESVADIYIAFADKDLYMMSGSEEVVPEDFDARTRSWYIQAVEDKATIVSAPYVDEISGNMMITIATPIYNGEELLGVAGEDVYITELVELTTGINFESGVYAFLVDGNGNYVSHPNEVYLPSAEGTTAVDENTKKTINDKTVHLHKDYTGKNIYLSTAEVGSCKWTLGIALPESSIQSKLTSLITISIVISLIMLLAIVFVVPMLVKKYLKPVETMKEFIKKTVIGSSTQDRKFKSRLLKLSIW